MPHRWGAALAAAAAIACLGLATAQNIAPDEMHARTVPYVPPSPLTLRTEAKLVEVPVVVRDARKRAVAGLTRDDFEIYDAGAKQTISAFSVESFGAHGSKGDTGSGAGPAVLPAAIAEPKSPPRPRVIALLFDDLHTDAPNLKAAKDAAQRFVKTALAPGDRVAVVTTAAPSQSAEFTADVPTLVERIAKVTTREKKGPWVCPTMETYEAYLIVNHLDNALLTAKIAECSACQHTPCSESQITSLANWIWDQSMSNTKLTLTVLDGLVDGMAKLPGQRVILLTAAELLMGNLEHDLNRLTAKALHAEVVVNTLDAKRLYVTFNPRTDGRIQDAKGDGMALLAAGTGGAFYHNSNDLAGGFRELGMLPETLYILGFVPSDMAEDGRYHSLKVNLRADKRYSLQTRLGYTAPSAAAASPVPQLSKLDSEAMASDTVADLPASFTWEQPAGRKGITMVAHLDVGRLHFLTWKDRRTQRLTIVAVLLDAHGAFVTGKRSEFELNLTEATFAELTKTSFTASMTIEAPPGNYSARALAIDGLDGKLTAANATVQVK
jgi:VWFA-related protein